MEEGSGTQELIHRLDGRQPELAQWLHAPVVAVLVCEPIVRVHCLQEAGGTALEHEVVEVGGTSLRVNRKRGGHEIERGSGGD